MNTGGSARRRTRNRARDDSGLALLDVLLGMAIFALIVIIALLAVGQFRQRAYRTAVNSDAQQVGVALESGYSDTQAYPAVLDTAALSKMGANLTKNNRVTEYTATSSSVTFCVEHSTGSVTDAWSRYTSAKGGISASGQGAGCAESLLASKGLKPFPCPTVTLSAVKVSGDRYNLTANFTLAEDAVFYRLLYDYKGAYQVNAANQNSTLPVQMPPGTALSIMPGALRQEADGSYTAATGCVPFTFNVPA